jgi:hypothetical protein
MRHFSKVIIELPDSPNDPPYAVLSIDCDVCGQEEIRIHMSHLGTVARILQQTIAGLGDDGFSDSVGSCLESTPANKAKVRDFLDRTFPGWKADRLRR